MHWPRQIPPHRLGRDGTESLHVATTEAQHHDCIIFIKVSAEPGRWRVDAGSVPPAAVLESGDDMFIFAELETLLSSDMLRILCAVCVYT